MQWRETFEAILKRIKSVVGGIPFEEQYQAALTEAQQEQRDLLERLGRMTSVDLAVGEGFIFGDRLEEEGVCETLVAVLKLLREALTEKRKAKLYQAWADICGIRLWGSRYQRLDMNAPLSLTEMDTGLINTELALIEAFGSQEKAGLVPKAVAVLIRDPLSKKSCELPLSSIEVQMVCFITELALADLQDLREEGRRDEEHEQAVLARASQALKLVGRLQGEEDRVSLLDTLVTLT